MSRYEEKRKKRIPLGSPRRKMSIEGEMDPGKHYRWINDKGNRLNEALDGDYAFEHRKPSTSIGGDGDTSVQSEMDSRISRVVGTGPDGQPIRAYLMSIDKDTYEADQRAKFDELDETERAIQRTANPDKDAAPDEHNYVPMKMTKPVTLTHERR